MKHPLFVFLLILALLSIIGCDSDKDSSPQTETSSSTVVPEPEITLLAGCSGCHGKDGVSSRSGIPFIAGQPAEYLEFAIRSYLIKDRNHEIMRQAVFDLDVQQRHELANYFASLDTKWTGGSETRKTHQPSKDKQINEQSIHAGEELSKPCSGCHGKNGNSVKAGVPSLAGLQPAYFVPALKAYLSGARQGAAIMKNFKLILTNENINNLAAYYSVQERQTSPLTDALQKVKPSNALTQRCLGCHGFDGNSTHPAMPSLAGQNATYLIKAMKKYRENKRSNQMMVDVAKGLSDEEIERNATYFATRVPVKMKQTSQANKLSIFDPLGEGKKLAVSCNGCHGNNGNNPVNGTPRLAGLSTRYLIDSISSYRNKKRNHPMMQVLAGFLSETDIEKLSLYYATQIPNKEKNTKGKTGTKNGKELAAGCTGCHGENGNSEDAKIPSLSGQNAAYLVSAINAYKENGTRNHTDMKNVVQELNKKAIDTLANYYSAQNPKRETPRVLESPAVLSRKCDRCHGINGINPNNEKPRIGGQRESYLISALKAYKNGDRTSSMMHAMSAELWDVEIEAIAEYYAGM